jgi:hypothetical protein
MADLLEQSSRWLADMNRRHRARKVIYVRGGDALELTATVGKSVFEVDKGYGLFERVETRDYLVDVTELASFGKPERGDRVKDELNGVVEVFEVMAPGNEPHFRYSDPYRQTYRIHTKHVSTEEPA